MKYKVVRDGKKWGVIWGEMDAFVNEEPMSKKEAIALANECNGNSAPQYVYVDNNPSEVYLED